MFRLNIGSINTSSFADVDRRIEIIKLMEEEKIDICCIQETRLKEKHWVVANKYNNIRNDTGVGTLIFIKNRLKFETLNFDDINHINLTAIKIDSKNRKDLIIISIYIPCVTSKSLLFKEMDIILKKIKHLPFVIGGDFNLAPKQLEYMKKWVDKEAHLVNLITPNAPTFRLGGKLDYFLTSTDIFTNKYCKVKDIGLEHNLIQTTLNINFQANVNPFITAFKWKKCDWTSFGEKATLAHTTIVPIDHNITNSEIDAIVDTFTTNIQTTMNNAVPRGAAGRFYINELPKEADHYYKERRRLKQILKRARTNNRLANNDRIEHLKRSVAEATKIIKKFIKDERTKILENRIKNINDNTNRFRELRRLNGQNMARKTITLKRADGTKIETAKETLNEIKDFYEELYSRRTPKCNELDKVKQLINILPNIKSITEFNSSNPANRPKVLEDKFTNCREVGACIRSISNKTSSGPDNIPNLIIKKLPFCYTATLTKIINHCINNSYFPCLWKKGTIIPIPKKAGTIETKDLRPISMTANPGKILEEIILRRLRLTIKDGTIPTNQFGFMQGHSTIDALTVFKEELLSSINSGNFLATCSLDIRKAFDSVWHEGLIYKLFKARCDRYTVRIIHSFLNDRTAVIKAENQNSDPIIIGRGVPQGTKLGPILYNIYTGDIKSNIKLTNNERIQTYADDTLISSRSPDAHIATERVGKRVEEIEKYLNNWGIEINAEKTKHLLARPKNKTIKYAKKGPLKLEVNGKTINREKSLKYLGVIFQHNGSFSKQAAEMAKRGRRLTGASIRILRNKTINYKLRYMTYKMFIRSSVTYASAIWASPSNIKNIEVMERWVFRHIENLYRNPDTKKWFSNEYLYKGIECEKMDEFLKRIHVKYKERMENHENPLVDIAKKGLEHLRVQNEIAIQRKEKEKIKKK